MKRALVEALALAAAALVFALAANAISPRGLPLFPKASPAGAADADLLRAAREGPGSGIVIVDARSAPQYAAGHIPHALLLDPADPEPTLAAVLAACAGAKEVIVYCEGGACGKSALAADLLRQAGIAPERGIAIYSGGYPAWRRGRQ